MRRLLALVCVSAALASPVRGETLAVSGVFPANSDAAAALRSISVERLGGEDGQALAIRIEDALRTVAIDGQRYFAMLPASLTRDADAVLRGSAGAEMEVTSRNEKRDKCLSRDPAGKCIERGKVDVVCHRRTVELGVTLRLVARNGDLVWRDDRPEQAEISYCDDDSSPPKRPEAMVRELLDKAAARVRRDLAPEFRRDLLRVMEDRRGLSRPDADRFRAALRLTRNNAPAACAEWQALAAVNPGHAASIFNTGLCAESQSDLESAEARYRRAGELSRAQVTAEALRRLEARRRALRQLEAHSAR